MTIPRTRLHITPFTPSLFAKIIPDSAKVSATDISYHALETFPERGFGYIDLPKEEADKLKKKLNGATLKGAKMRVEEARPAKKRKSEETEEERGVRKKSKREKVKVKKEDGVIPGWEMEEGRHVKRGWSDGKVEKKEKRAKKGEKVKEKKEGKGKAESREGKKVVFRTAVPPNAMPVDEKAGKTKDKIGKRERKGKTPTVVREFANTRKTTGGAVDRNVVQPTLTYEEGKGWVDEEGAVVEAEPPSSKRRRERREAKEAKRAAEEAAETERAAEKIGTQAPAKSPTPAAAEPEDVADNAGAESDSAASSNSVSDDLSSSDSASASASPTTSPERPTSQTSLKTTPPPTTTAAARAIHPLEALYKRTTSSTSTPAETDKPSLQPINTSFSFFNPDAAEAPDNETSHLALPPQTPHTKQDLEWRALRSAAPTPDTAAIGRKFSFPFASSNNQNEDEDEDEEMADDDVPALKLGAINEAADEEVRSRLDSTGEGDAERREEESAFRKWFFEHRGDNNRAWKRKRREGKKVLRQRENRRYGWVAWMVGRGIWEVVVARLFVDLIKHTSE